MLSTSLRCLRAQLSRRSFSNGASGDIRGAGGTFGKKEKAQEEQYFRQKEKEELEQLKKKLDTNKDKKPTPPKK